MMMFMVFIMVVMMSTATAAFTLLIMVMVLVPLLMVMMVFMLFVMVVMMSTATATFFLMVMMMLMSFMFMMVMFIWNKVPFGVTTMTCCLLLAMFGIVDIPKAFGGFGNKIVVLIAPMLVLSGALGKTSLVMKISSVLNAAKGKRGTVLILVFYAVGMVMAQFIPTTAAISILVIFLLTLDNTGEITPKRLLLPLLGVMVGCKFRFPVYNLCYFKWYV